MHASKDIYGVRYAVMKQLHLNVSCMVYVLGLRTIPQADGLRSGFLLPIYEGLHKVHLLQRFG